MANSEFRSSRRWIAATIVFLMLVLSAWPSAAADRSVPRMTIELLADPGGGLTIEDMLREETAARFTRVPDSGINLGYVQDAIWLRLTVSSTETREKLFSITPNIIDFLDVYIMSGSGADSDFILHELGDHRPLSDTLSGLDHVIPLELVAGEPMRLYVRAFAVNTVMSLNLALYSPADHTRRTTVSGLVAGSWFGGMAVLLIIQLVFYYYDRKPYFVLLALSTFNAILVYFGTLGLSRLFLFPDGGAYNDYFTAAVSWLGISSSALAVRSILDLRRNARWLDWIFIAGVAFGIVGVGFAFAGANMAFAPVAQLAIVVLSTLCVYQSIRMIDRADAGSHLRAAAFVSLWGGLVLTIVQRAGFDLLPDLATHGYAVSCVIYTILLTGALAERLRSAEAANATMREQALADAQAAERRAIDLVRERTRELADAKQVAEDALAAELESQRRQVRFMEVISHQYRTPLAAIQTHVSNIGLSLPQEDEANRKRLAGVRRGIARLVEVLEVNLSRSRLQGPAFAAQLSPQSPGRLAEEAALRARDLLNAEILVDVASAARKAKVMADSDMFIIALINLLENAAKFTRPGSNGPVRLGVARKEGEIVFQVEDRGLGIPPEDLGKIFDPHFRGVNAAKISGTGSGLSLVRRMTAAHHGTVEVESVVGEGTLIRLIVPACP